MPIWPDTEFRCLGRVDCSCSTCTICCVTLITNSVIRKGPICDYHKQNISTDVFNVTCLMRLKTFLHIWMFKDTLWYYHLVLIYITCNMCLSIMCINIVSDWLLFNATWTIFSGISWRGQVTFNEMKRMSFVLDWFI